MIKVGINGFGRIGRVLTRLILKSKDFKLLAINDIYDNNMRKYLFEHDSVYGSTNYNLDKVRLLSQPNIKDIPWQDVDIVFECSGKFSKKEELDYHLKNGAKKVILSAFSNSIPIYICGFNDNLYKNENIISNSSCTANCVVPILHIIDKNFGVEKCNITTVHSWTIDQNLLDNKNKDLRRARSAPNNIIPLDSNVANATSFVMPHLKGKLYSKSIRVPIANGVIIDLHIKLSKKTTLEEIVNKLEKNINKNINFISEEEIASSDITGTKYSAIIDKNLIHLNGGDFLQLFLWQDNEMGYTHRLLDLGRKVVKK